MTFFVLPETKETQLILMFSQPKTIHQLIRIYFLLSNHQQLIFHYKPYIFLACFYINGKLC